jgi:hypothetical protein
MPAHEAGHHGSKKLSLKLKIVIVLLAFGFIMLFLDTIQDRSDKGPAVGSDIAPEEPKKRAKSKAKKKSKVSSNAL